MRTLATWILAIIFGAGTYFVVQPRYTEALVVAVLAGVVYAVYVAAKRKKDKPSSPR